MTIAERRKKANAAVEKFENCEHQNVQDFTECCLDCGENIYCTSEEIYKRIMNG